MTHPRLLFLTAFASLFFSGSLSADWPRFRGPQGSGSAPLGKAPSTWDESKNIAWKTPLPGPGTSSPIVWKDHVYLTCHTGYGLGSGKAGKMDDLKRFLLCFRLADGKPIWKREVGVALPETKYAKRMEWHGYASSTPVADKDGVYAFFGKSGVFAFSHDGEPQWKKQVGNNTHGWGSAASPILVDDLLVINAYTECGALVALDRKTGNERWRYEGLKEAWNTPVLAKTKEGSPELVIGIVGKILGLDPATGKELWSCKGADWYIVSSPVAHQNTVFSLSGKGVEAATAVRIGGRGEVTKSHRLWQTRKGSNVSSPVYHKGRLYFAHDQGLFFYCLDAKTGEIVFQERLPRGFGTIYSSPVLADGKIILFSRQSGALVLEAGDSYKVISHNPPLDRSPINASPAVVGNQLLIRSDQFLYCLAESP